MLLKFFFFLFVKRKWIVFAVFCCFFSLFRFLFAVSHSVTLFLLLMMILFFFLFSFYDYYLFFCYLSHRLTRCFHRKTDFTSFVHHNANASLFNALVVIVVVVVLFGSFFLLLFFDSRLGTDSSFLFLSIIQMKILVEQTNERNNKNNTNTHIKRIDFNG